MGKISGRGLDHVHDGDSVFGAEENAAGEPYAAAVGPPISRFSAASVTRLGGSRRPARWVAGAGCQVD